MILFRSLFLLLIFHFGRADEAEPTKPALMERLVKTLPDIPNVIKGQMEGKPDELKKMISNMLGDGLLSQLVVNPIGVAENMGVPLDQLGINRTVVDEMMGAGTITKANSGETSSKPFEKFFGSFTVAPTTTTEKTMYVDGVPIKNFDDFIRKHNLEKNGYTTKSPPTTTESLSSEKIAAAVLQGLKQHESMNPTLNEPPRHHSSDIANTFDINLVDPNRVAEVNKLLRRAPQNFELSKLSGDNIGPPGFLQSMDPPIDEVITSLRTKSSDGLSVDDVKRLQNILQTYEQTLQTKELLTKRKQLQVLQTELVEQKKRIEIQKRAEEELKKKAEELEAAKRNMEEQLRVQLNNWHSSFEPAERRSKPMNFDNGSFGLGAPSTTAAVPAKVDELNTLPSTQQQFFNDEQEQRGMEERSSTPQPPKPNNVLMKHLRYSSSTQPPLDVSTKSEVMTDLPPSTAVQREEEDAFSSCDCEKISINKMSGKWLLALSSDNILERVQTRAFEFADDDASELSCSRFDVFSGKRSSVAQDAHISWQYKTSKSQELFKIRGTALTFNHKSIQIKMNNSENKFNFPFCVLKSGGTINSYNYLLITDSEDNCKNAALFVRDPQEFFDEPDKNLQEYLKNKIGRKLMNPMNIVKFGDC